MRRLGLALLLSLAACGPKPPPGSIADRIKAEDMIGKVFDGVFGGREGVYDDPALVAYVAEVGARVAARTPVSERRWSFHVLDQTEVNAYAMAGGHVYVTRGTLAILDSEAELAAVLAHEIAHVVAGHSMSTLSDLGSGGRLSEDPDEAGSDRDVEYQADQMGIRYLRAAGYDAHTFSSMLRVLHAWDSDAAYATPLRVRLTRAALVIGDHDPGAGPGEAGRERFLQHLDGLVMGADPRAGHVDGQRFVDERSGFSLTLAPTLTGEMTERTLLAKDAAKTSGLTLLPFASPGSLVFDALVEGMKKNGPVDRRPLPVGFALVGLSEGVPLALVTVAGRTHVLAAAAPDPAAARRLLETTLATYRAVDAKDRHVPRRLRIAVADRSAAVSDLLRTGCGDGDRAMGLRLHGPASGRVLQAGERFKCAPR